MASSPGSVDESGGHLAIIYLMSRCVTSCISVRASQLASPSTDFKVQNLFAFCISPLFVYTIKQHVCLLLHFKGFCVLDYNPARANSFFMQTKIHVPTLCHRDDPFSCINIIEFSNLKVLRTILRTRTC